MTDKHKISSTKAVRLLTGNLSREEEKQITESEAFEQIVAGQWNVDGNDTADFRSDEVWSRISDSIPPYGLRRSGNGKRRAALWSAAASLIILLGIGYYFMQSRLTEPVPMNMIVMETASQQRLSITLPDSTLVWLNAGSRLEYPETFSDSVREVKLIGEAYFDVVRKDKKPFVVATDKLRVRVLGTRFTVSDYVGETDANAVLISGKVNIDVKNDTNERAFTLVPYERMYFDQKSNMTLIKTVDVSQYADWINGYLRFDDTDLGVVVSRLEHWYGASIEYPEEMSKQHRLTFTVRRESLEHIMELMQNVIPVGSTKTGVNSYRLHDFGQSRSTEPYETN